MSTPFTIRESKKEDCLGIEKLIRELAEYEKMPNGPKLDADILMKDGGFTGEAKYFHSFVATLDEAPDSVIGFVLFFYVYSTWEGKSIWMEDLYVQPDHRGKGIGVKLWQAVAQKAHREKCGRIDFPVLDWNKPSIKFYEANGAVNVSDSEGWRLFRLKPDAIAKLANK